MDWLTDPQIWIALATLTALELVLGIDKIKDDFRAAGNKQNQPRHQLRGGMLNEGLQPGQKLFHGRTARAMEMDAPRSA